MFCTSDLSSVALPRARRVGARVRLALVCGDFLAVDVFV